MSAMLEATLEAILIVTPFFLAACILILAALPIAWLVAKIVNWMEP